MTGIAHRAWLQAVMAHRVLTHQQAKILHRRALDLCQLEYDEADWDDFYSDVRASLGETGLELRTITDELTGTNVLAVVNTKGDDIAQVATTYTGNELGYLKRIVAAIFTAPDEAYSVGSTEALIIAAEVKPVLKRKTAQDLLANLVGHGWLRLSRAGIYSLGSRAILELQSYLKSEFPDFVLVCNACEDLVTRGQACGNAECDCKMHYHCARVHDFGKVKRCPKCEDVWDPLPIGEESIGSGRKPNGNGPESDDDEEAEAGGSTQGTPRNTGGRRSNARVASGSRGTTKKRARRGRDDDDDEEEAEEALMHEDEDDEEAEESMRAEMEEDDDDEDDEGTSSRRRSKAQRSTSNKRRRPSGRSGSRRFVDDDADEGEEE